MCVSLHQGEDGEAGDPGFAGEPGVPVSPRSTSFSLSLRCISFLLLIVCHFVCRCLRAVKATWGRRATLVLLVQQGPRDPEERQAMTEPKATLYVFVSMDQ